MKNKKRIAVILFNLGGPDQESSIQPFLKNFFMDKNIIAAPWPVRFLVSRLIAFKRGKGEALESYKALGYKSPLLENSEQQRMALERSLGKDYDGQLRCFVSMRYWHPMADQVVQQVKEYNPEKIILVPLYPQFSTTTSFSSLQDWQRACEKHDFKPASITLCCYPFQDGFIQASADLVNHTWQKALKNAPDQKMRLLFSAHGLPEKIIKDGDPYQWQCEESARKIAMATGIKDLDWQICYQSRVGPLKWIGPSTEEALEKAAHDKVGVVIYPHAFVSEHVETLVEIEEEYRELAEKLGVPVFIRVPTVMTHPKFIVGLKEWILQNLDTEGIVSHAGASICPAEFKNCCQRRSPYG